MNQSELSHQLFLDFKKNPMFVKDLAKSSDMVRKNLKGILKGFGDKNSKQKTYLSWILEMSEKDFYLLSPAQGQFFLMNRKLNSAVLFRYCTTITEETKRILKDCDECIEIIELHSTERGQGTRIMSDFIHLSQITQLPLALYAETIELTHYYEKFNFVNHGKLGSNKEFLMLRTTESSGE
ncbi:hypothetical protein [Paenibacillus rubinfantis]|uniref:hypothetical protein n=1 Tax=Paenibacillus rubinfantis TaxID=1720296 RepID=UPI00073F9166|nr:hypothetical protein [Paenibacillus rubinfantis]